MKNIIIPTILEEDTVHAVRTALSQTGYKSYSIILFLVKDIPDTFSAVTSLRQLSHTWTKSQEAVLEKCRKLISKDSNIKLAIHHQFGISGPLLKNVMEHLEAGFVILTPSFKSHKSRENRQLTRLLLRSRYTLLHLNSVQVQAISKALYIEPKTTGFTVQELQQMLNNKFNFRIISRTKLSDELSLEDANPIIAEAITSKQIDVLVETRKAVPKNLKEDTTTHNLKFGVPVLSIYEEDLLN